jgi:hypothetical protein
MKMPIEAIEAREWTMEKDVLLGWSGVDVEYNLEYINECRVEDGKKPVRIDNDMFEYVYDMVGENEWIHEQISNSITEALGDYIREVLKDE